MDASDFFQEVDPIVQILIPLSYKDTIAFCQVKRDTAKYCEDYFVWYNKAKARISDGVNPDRLKLTVKVGEKPSIMYQQLALDAGIVNLETDEIKDFGPNLEKLKLKVGKALADDNLVLVEWLLEQDPDLTRIY